MYAIFVLLYSLLLACGDNNTDAEKQVAEVSSASTSSLTISAENKDKVIAALQKADLADGKEDKVVEKCAGCALHMNGLPEHQVTVEDTTLHLCAASCKSLFEKQVEKTLMSLL